MRLPDFAISPQAVALDLDGTLLDSCTRLPERNQAAVRACVKRGIPVIIATSRPLRILNRILPVDLAETCSTVIMNGAISVGKGPLSGFFKEPLSDSLAEAVIVAAREFDKHIRITIEIDGRDFGVNWQADPDTLWKNNSATPDMLLTIEDALLRQPCKIALSSREKDILTLIDILKRDFDSSLSVIPSLLNNPLLNITAASVSKPSALRKLLAPLGISLDGVLAVGDDIPDLEMLRECGLPVAMANAFAEVKAVCAYETAGNDEYGVALVLEKMLAVGG